MDRHDSAGKKLSDHGIHFVGSGVSGGEEGARFGPSLMPGGSIDAWNQIKDIWLSISAKVDSSSGKPLGGAEPGKPVEGGVPCAAYIGTDGSGHYVKMVHNGIEYADMQMICEAYPCSSLGGLSANQIGEIFKSWDEGILDSFLIEITGTSFVSKILVAETPLWKWSWTQQDKKEPENGLRLMLLIWAYHSYRSGSRFARCLKARSRRKEPTHRNSCRGTYPITGLLCRSLCRINKRRVVLL